MDGIKLHRIVCRSFAPGTVIAGGGVPERASNDGQPPALPLDPATLLPSFVAPEPRLR
jgi:hypothetical protein